ncbi:hypothetical protein [Streptomyces sp. N35]|uniref:hypothetical protein n=1 Tax=Streptomyces sp. N35 TaxID=2795730 RepID=UPI0018F3ED1D|nr:hypothetical protein [Streptomyces sp. N35]
MKVAVRLSAHRTARRVGAQEARRLAEALTQLNIPGQVPEAVGHAFTHPSWRYQLVYCAATVIRECAAAHQHHLDTSGVAGDSLDGVRETARPALAALHHVHWMRGSISRRSHRNARVRAHRGRVMNRMEWAGRSLDAAPAANLPPYAHRWLTIADRYMTCTIGRLLDDVAPSTART